MLATIINVVLVLIGSAVGLLFKNIISEKLMSVITHALGLWCTVKWTVRMDIQQSGFRFFYSFPDSFPL